MTTVQKIIKYFAIALAIFIIVSIVSGILFGLNTFSDLLGLTRENDIEYSYEDGRTEKIEKSFDSVEIANLKINLAYSSLTIKQGENFHVETNSKDVEFKQRGNELIVKEKDRNFFTVKSKRTTIVTIPKDTILNNVDIETGAGKIDIEKLSAKNLSLELGAGKMTIQDLQVTQKAKIDGGAGKVDILSGSINNLDLEMGVGSFKLVSELSGNNKIDAGIGKLELELKNGLDKYTIRANRGIGTIKIGDKEITDNVEYGSGETNVKINGGIGSIDIK